MIGVMSREPNEAKRRHDRQHLLSDAAEVGRKDLEKEARRVALAAQKELPPQRITRATWIALGVSVALVLFVLWRTWERIFP
jgi:hypothetical protein